MSRSCAGPQSIYVPDTKPADAPCPQRPALFFVVRSAPLWVPRVWARPGPRCRSRGFRWEGCCVVRAGWPGDPRWQFLRRGCGGRGASPVCWKGHVAPIQGGLPAVAGGTARAAVRVQQKNAVRLSVCETPAARPVAAPRPRTAPSPLPPSGSLVGQGAFSATLPHVCVSHSDILPVPTQDLGFLCPGCAGCTPYPQGPAVLPGARPTTEPGTRRPSTCPPALLSLSPASPSPGTGFSSSPKPVTTQPVGLRDVCERSRAGSAPGTPPLSRSPRVKAASAPGF